MAEEVNAARAGEIAKYEKIYDRPKYRMGDERKDSSQRQLYKHGGRYRQLLDVGAGRGEMLDYALSIGFGEVLGTEVARDLIAIDRRLMYAEAHALPFSPEQFEVVTCFDVLEHLTPADVVPAIEELFRVARYLVIVSAARDSQMIDGVEHHVSRRSLHAWRELLETLARPKRFELVETARCRKGSDLWTFRSHYAVRS